MATASQETAAFTGRSGPCERAPLSRVASKLSGGLRLAVLVSAVLLNGCGQSPAPLLSEPPSASISPADLADAIRFRTSSGLRADEAWIVAVAADARSADGAREYGVPLLPDELVELARRAANSDAIFDVVESYGQRHPADFGGLFVDNAGDGAVVALFSRNVAVHDAALRLLVNPKAAFEVRPVRWSLAELDAFKATVDADTSWLVPLGGAFVRSQVVPERNTVELRVSSASPDIVTVVTRHYGANGWLTVISDGIGPWSGGRGDLIVRVIVPAGMTPERSYACSLHPDDPAAYGDPGVEVDTDANRACRYEQIGATGYRVEIAGDAGRLVGTSRATVIVSRTVTVDVLLSEPGPPTPHDGRLVRPAASRRSRSRPLPLSPSGGCVGAPGRPAIDRDAHPGDPVHRHALAGIVGSLVLGISEAIGEGCSVPGLLDGAPQSVEAAPTSVRDDLLRERQRFLAIARWSA